MEKPLLTYDEVAERWKCSKSAIKSRIQLGTLARADVPGYMIAFEEVRAHEVMMTYGKTPDEKELIARLMAAEEKNKILSARLKELKKWRNRVLNAIEEDI